MQSWGTQSRLDVRRTDLEPSKSGIVGLLCAALGRDRQDPIEDLAGLRMGVRADKEGVLRYDYQTAQNVFKASGKGTENVQSWRYYLADATFLVGLWGSDLVLLERIHQSLLNPRWTLFLGRKGYLPSQPVHLPDGLQDMPLERALAAYSPLVEPPPDKYRYALEVEEGQGGSLRFDQPLGPFFQRSFGARRVLEVTLPRGAAPHVHQ